MGKKKITSQLIHFKWQFEIWRMRRGNLSFFTILYAIYS